MRRFGSSQNDSVHAFVAPDQKVALFAGVSGVDEFNDGTDHNCLVDQAQRAASEAARLCGSAGFNAEPHIILRIHTSAQAEYSQSMDEVGDVVRDAFSDSEPVVSVTLTDRLINAGALIEIDGVIAA